MTERDIERRIGNNEQAIKRLATKDDFKGLRSLMVNFIGWFIGIMTIIVGGGMSWMISINSQVTENTTRLSVSSYK